MKTKMDSLVRIFNIIDKLLVRMRRMRRRWGESIRNERLNITRGKQLNVVKNIYQ